MRRVINSQGLGGLEYNPQTMSFDTVATPSLIATCNSGVYWVNPVCWQYSRAAWSQMAALPAPALTSNFVAPAAPPSAITAPYAPTQAEIDASIAAAAAQTQQNIADYASTLPDNPIPDVPCTVLNIPCSYLWIGGLSLAAIAALMLTGGRR